MTPSFRIFPAIAVLLLGLYAPIGSATTALENSDIDLNQLQMDMLNIKPLAKVDLNHAEAASIANTVKGIGEKRAEAIVAHRDENGPFTSFEELAEVKGLSHGFIAENQEVLAQVFMFG